VPNPSRVPAYVQLPSVMRNSQIETPMFSRMSRLGRCRNVLASTLKLTAQGEPSPGSAMTFLSNRIESTEPSKLNTIPAFKDRIAISVASTADAAFGWPHRQKIRSPGQHELGFAPTFAAPRLRHASSCRRRRSSRHPGATRPSIALHHAKIHARLHPPVDGHLRGFAGRRDRRKVRR